MSKPKYHVGQVVRVNHRTCGGWTGTITSRNLTDDSVSDIHGHCSGWEYEVSDAPLYCENALYGYHWLPLVWESEIVEVLS